MDSFWFGQLSKKSSLMVLKSKRVNRVVATYGFFYDKEISRVSFTFKTVFVFLHNLAVYKFVRVSENIFTIYLLAVLKAD